MTQGRILAAFHIFEYPKDSIEKTTYTGTILQDNNSVEDGHRFDFIQADIKFPIVGIRDLPFKMKFPEILHYYFPYSLGK